MKLLKTFEHEKDPTSFVLYKHELGYFVENEWQEKGFRMDQGRLN